MIIVNQELIGKNLLTNKFNKFSKINIEYKDIYTLIYYEQIPRIKNIILLPNLKKLYIFTNDIMKYTPRLVHSKLRKFLSQLICSENLEFLSIIGYNIIDENNEISCLNNLPYNLETLEFSMLKYFNIKLDNLPINLKNLNIDINDKLDYKKIEEYFNIKYPIECELCVISDFLLFYKYLRNFSINEIYSR